jgi:hypothetical protein
VRLKTVGGKHLVVSCERDGARFVVGHGAG